MRGDKEGGKGQKTASHQHGLQGEAGGGPNTLANRASRDKTNQAQFMLALERQEMGVGLRISSNGERAYKDVPANLNPLREENTNTGSARELRGQLHVERRSKRPIRPTLHPKNNPKRRRRRSNDPLHRQEAQRAEQEEAEREAQEEEVEKAREEADQEAAKERQRDAERRAPQEEKERDTRAASRRAGALKAIRHGG
jgi:hypothetical protein